MGLIVAGDRSGVGKTTVTMAILAFLAAKSRRVQSFKVGPDYIDPMFHRAITGLPCRNLDPVLTSADYVKHCFNLHASAAEHVVVEGVMGLFDGIYHLDSTQVNDYGSTAHIARILDLDILLVLDCSSLSTSIAAIAYGYANLDRRLKIAGVILNRVASDRHEELLRTALEQISMPVLGVIRRNAQITIPDRHLGLVPSAELSNLDSIFDRLAKLARDSFDWHKLLPLIAGTSVAQGRSHNSAEATSKSENKVKIAVARDRAFNFYYQDNLDLLEELGAELVFWSPLNDSSMPQNIGGLYFGGGFPEIFAEQLGSNLIVTKQLRQVIRGGMPTYAECGGLMYLCQELIARQQSHLMVGVIPHSVTMEAKLTLGYRRAIALRDSSLVEAGQTLIGHEFHRSQIIASSTSPNSISSQWQLQGFHRSSPQLTEGWNIYQLHASYLHLHWGVARSVAQRFVRSCRSYNPVQL